MSPSLPADLGRQIELGGANTKPNGWFYSPVLPGKLHQATVGNHEKP